MIDSQNATEEAILPQVTGPALASVVVLSVATVHSAHQQAQRIFATRKQNQMHMIAHQTPGPDPNVCFAQVLLQQPQIGMSIFIKREGRLAVYSSLRDMIRNSGKNTPRSSRHRRTLYLAAEKNRADQFAPDLPPICPRFAPICRS